MTAVLLRAVVDSNGQALERLENSGFDLPSRIDGGRCTVANQLGDSRYRECD